MCSGTWWPQRSPGMSHAFIQFNRNKRSVSLDLKSMDGIEAMHRLLKTADVVLSNLRPSAMKGLGLDYEAMRAIKPDLILLRRLRLLRAGSVRRPPGGGRHYPGDVGPSGTAADGLRHTAVRANGRG
jgi:hypothetical protein